MKGAYYCHQMHKHLTPVNGQLLVLEKTKRPLNNVRTETGNTHVNIKAINYYSK